MANQNQYFFYSNEIENKKYQSKVNDTDKTTIPITYPSLRFEKTNVAMPSDYNVEEAKDWVDHFTLL